MMGQSKFLMFCRVSCPVAICCSSCAWPSEVRWNCQTVEVLQRCRRSQSCISTQRSKCDKESGRGTLTSPDDLLGHDRETTGVGLLDERDDWTDLVAVGGGR